MLFDNIFWYKVAFMYQEDRDVKTPQAEPYSRKILHQISMKSIHFSNPGPCRTGSRCDGFFPWFANTCEMMRFITVRAFLTIGLAVELPGGWTVVTRVATSTVEGESPPAACPSSDWCRRTCWQQQCEGAAGCRRSRWGFPPMKFPFQTSKNHSWNILETSLKHFQNLYSFSFDDVPFDERLNLNIQIF